MKAQKPYSLSLHNTAFIHIDVLHRFKTDMSYGRTDVFPLWAHVEMVTHFKSYYRGVIRRNCSTKMELAKR